MRKIVLKKRFKKDVEKIKTHTARNPRGYLEFLDDFFKKLGATTQQIDEQTASQLMIAEKT